MQVSENLTSLLSYPEFKLLHIYVTEMSLKASVSISKL